MTFADRLLYLLTLLLLPFVYWQFWQADELALYADIHVNGQYQQRIALNKDRTLHVHGERGDSIMEVHDGKVRFKDSACTSKRCVLSGWLQHSGEFAACLPNKVSVALLSKNSRQARFDSINF
jgi:hypothetical protein